MNILERFHYTLKEYKRFSDFFAVEGNHSLQDKYDEQEYIAVITKLMLMRKYGSKGDDLAVPSVINELKKEYPDSESVVSELQGEFDSIQNKPLKTVLSDGKEKEFYKIIEDVVYGIYLHADPDKIKDLQNNDISLWFSLARCYVEQMEELLYKVQEAISEYYQYSEGESIREKAPVISIDNNDSEFGITNDKYWSNLKGSDLKNEEVESALAGRPAEDIAILRMTLLFITELERNDYSVQRLEELVFPPTRSDWGDFSLAHDAVKRAKNIGWSTYIEYNEQKDMAYVKLLQHVEEGFVIEGAHMIASDVAVVTLVNEKRYGWRIYKIGERAENYKETLSLTESVRKIMKRG